MASNTIGLAPPSPAFSVPSTHSLQFNNSCSPSAKSPPDYNEMRASSGPGEDGNADPPYSLLIYQALRSAPGMKLPLQGIYSWFEKNTEKGKDQSSKGWQNSIRHNLSMNAGFEAVKEIAGGKKAVNFWRLTDAAVKDGIQSTTRYRKQANCRKAVCLEPPAPQRQRSGARGGKAAKVTARYRPNHHDELRRERHYRTRATTTHRRPEKNIYLQNPTTMFPAGVPSPAAPMGHSIETFDLRHVVGCTDYSPTTPIFSDMDAAESDYFSLGIGSLGWCGIHPATSGGFWAAAGPEISTDLHVEV
ncbi:Forkhead domain protein [Aspergillus sp. HF37]|nr:Forkhead domain protein [Aspergillus sp. HF37]